MVIPVADVLLIAVLVLVGLVVVPIVLIGFVRFVKRAKRLRAIEGAAFWLTSLLLSLIFVFFGIVFGIYVHFFQ